MGSVLGSASDVDSDESVEERPWRQLLHHEGRDPAGPQLTVRAVAAGLFVGTLLCFTNMYFGLQTGWITAGSLQSTILGFGLFKLLRPRLRRSFGPLENVALQTVAVATATMPLAGGFVGIIPALAMLPPAAGGPRHLSGVELCGWSAALAFFGAFVAVRSDSDAARIGFDLGLARKREIDVIRRLPYISLSGLPGALCRVPG